METVFNPQASAGVNRARKNINRKVNLLDLEFPARTDCLLAARQAVARVADDLDLASDDTSDLILAVGEACNNAVQHGSRACDRSVRLRCRLKREGFSGKARALEVDIANSGNGFVPEKGSRFPMPDADDLVGHGRGLPLMQQLVDNIEILCENGSTVVRLTKNIS